MDRIRELVTDSGYVPSVIGGCAVIATVGYHVLLRPMMPGRTGWTFFKQQSDYPWLVLVLIARMARRQAWEGGLGRHTQEEVTMVTGQDYEALSTQIDDHPFLMGSQPCEEDCAIFGMLAQARWQLPGTPHEKFVTETYPNLAAYCERMKGRFWPDWDDCITHGGTKAVTK